MKGIPYILARIETLLIDNVSEVIEPVDVREIVDIITESVGLQEYQNDTTVEYLVGQSCKKDGIIYECNTETTGVFNAAHWNAIGSGGGAEITDTAKRNYLQDNANWESPSRPFSDPTTADKYYPIYSGTAITGQSEHDYYIGTDSVTSSIYKYLLVNISSTLTPIRIPLVIN
jgi:hypothetical protein